MDPTVPATPPATPPAVLDTVIAGGLAAPLTLTSLSPAVFDAMAGAPLDAECVIGAAPTRSPRRSRDIGELHAIAETPDLLTQILNDPRWVPLSPVMFGSHHAGPNAAATPAPRSLPRVFAPRT